jgi:predicted RecB family nuclease
MHYNNKKLVYSPSDIVQFVNSQFACWMNRKLLEEPKSEQPDEDDPQLKILQNKGGLHEKAYLNKLLEAGSDVCEITSGDRLQQTLKAINEGRQIIFQARLEGTNMAGNADFLRLEGQKKSTYTIIDTKLSRHVKPHFMIQLCCYADMLEEMTGKRSETIGIVLGNGEECCFRTNDVFYYYERTKSAFFTFMDNFSPNTPPQPDPSADHGSWSSHANQILEDMDHLSRVANISKKQILKLNAVEIDTMEELSTSTAIHIKGINDDVFARLKEQASLQVSSANQDCPNYKVLQPPPDNQSLGLAALPPESPMDVFFDMEGYPLGDDLLEYLFGVVYIENGEPEFIDWWAHNEPEEKTAFEAFIDWVIKRRQEDPTMHVYHYAAYEKTALKRLMGKYGTREEHVDDLLREGVFVDLYEVVRHGVRIGEPRYSIKNLEHLYMESREGDVTDAGASIVFYDTWIESGQSKDWKESDLLKKIRDYNEDDCRSTWLLANWLRERQTENNISWVGTLQDEEKEEHTASDAVVLRQELADKLFAEIPEDQSEREKDLELWRVQELLAWTLEFHRRCDKPMWWELFERLEKTENELVDDMSCLGGLKLVGKPVPEKRSLLFNYKFDPDQETKITEGSAVKIVPGIDATPNITDFNSEGQLTIKISLKKLQENQMKGLPKRMSVIPHNFVSAKIIDESIYAVINQYHDTKQLPGALKDFVYRRPPILKSGYKGPLIQTNESNIEGAIRLAMDMDNTCMCIQGPPGTGKTYTSAHVIVQLLSEGKKVGITSNSHKAITNLMRTVSGLSNGTATGIKVGGGEDTSICNDSTGVKYIGDSGRAAAAYENGMIGGSAWFFSREEMQESLDYLFIDEAGQVSVAKLIGIARSTQNLILLGDQMQLGQPIQGAHPGESGMSVLEYYLKGHATIPPEQGIFLETTWRMHPEICTFISETFYEGRLQPEPHTKNRTIRIPDDGGSIVAKEAGIIFVPVIHEGNTQGSDEESEVIRKIVDELIGRDITDKDGNICRQVTIYNDILFVTPYNLQVRKLANLLPDGARVASVDKFQGQEAPIVIISMCSSPGEFGSRGMEFLLDKNRLNVAVSRAQSLAIIVGDPRLVETNCTSISNMERLNMYCKLQDTGNSEV